MAKMINIKMSDKKVRDVKGYLKQGVQKGYKQALAISITEEADRTLTTSLERTPEETGYLKKSAYLQVLNATSYKQEPKIIMGYTAWYAAIVHQMTNKRYKTGRAKYLESALNDAQAGYTKRIAEGTQEAFKKKRKYTRKKLSQHATRPDMSFTKPRPKVAQKLMSEQEWQANKSRDGGSDIGGGGA